MKKIICIIIIILSNYSFSLTMKQQIITPMGGLDIDARNRFGDGYKWNITCDLYTESKNTVITIVDELGYADELIVKLDGVTVNRTNIEPTWCHSKLTILGVERKSGRISTRSNGMISFKNCEAIFEY